MLNLIKKIYSTYSPGRGSTRTSSGSFTFITLPESKEEAVRELITILGHEDWKARIAALPEPDYTRLIQAKNLALLNHGHELSDRQSKASWLDAKGSAISQRQLHRH